MNEQHTMSRVGSAPDAPSLAAELRGTLLLLVGFAALVSAVVVFARLVGRA